MQVPVTYSQVIEAAHAAGVFRTRKRFMLADVLRDPNAVNLILSNARDAQRLFGFSNSITDAVRKHFGVRREIPQVDLLKLLNAIITRKEHADSRAIDELLKASLPYKAKSRWAVRRTLQAAMKEGWLIRSANASLKYGYLYALPKFRRKVVSHRGFDFYFDCDDRSIGEVVAAVIDGQPNALTIEEVHLALRDATGFSMNPNTLGKLVRKSSKTIFKWGRNHRLVKGYLFYTRPEQLERRLQSKEALLPETVKLVYHNTARQCLTVTQTAELCHISEALVRYAADKLNLLGLRKTELFHGLRIIYDPEIPENELTLAKQSIESEIRRQAEIRFVHGDTFACYAALCILLDQYHHNLDIVKTEMHFGRHKFDTSDLHIFGKQGLTIEKIIAEFKSGHLLKLADARRFCEKLRHERGVTKALMVYRDASAKAINYFSYFHEAPLQWISATTIARRYGDLIGFRLRAETFSQFLDDARLGFSQLKEMLENNPLRLKSQLMIWLQTRTIKTPLRSREASTERTLEKDAVDLSDDPKD
jgi:hypothetical protein